MIRCSHQPWASAISFLKKFERWYSYFPRFSHEKEAFWPNLLSHRHFYSLSCIVFLSFFLLFIWGGGLSSVITYPLSIIVIPVISGLQEMDEMFYRHIPLVNPTPKPATIKDIGFLSVCLCVCVWMDLGWNKPYKHGSRTNEWKYLVMT